MFLSRLNRNSSLAATNCVICWLPNAIPITSEVRAFLTAIFLVTTEVRLELLSADATLTGLCFTFRKSLRVALPRTELPVHCSSVNELFAALLTSECLLSRSTPVLYVTLVSAVLLRGAWRRLELLATPNANSGYLLLWSSARGAIETAIVLLLHPTSRPAESLAACYAELSLVVSPRTKCSTALFRATFSFSGSEVPEYLPAPLTRERLPSCAPNGHDVSYECHFPVPFASRRSRRRTGKFPPAPSEKACHAAIRL